MAAPPPPDPGAADGSAAAIVRYGYDADGRIDRITRSNAPELRLRYDERGLLSHLTRDSHEEVFRHDRSGALAGLEEPGGHWTITSDSLEQRRSVTYPSGDVVVQKLSLEGRIEHVHWEQGRHVLAYTRDLLGQTTAIDTPAGRFTIHRDRTNRRITREYPNGALSQFELNRDGRATRILHATPDRRVFRQFEYRYDDQLRLIETRDSGRLGTATTRYRYDAYGQLLAADRSDGAECRYAYDRFGNLTLLHEGNIRTTMAYTGADRLASFDETPVEHDDDGNVTHLGGVTFEHDFRRRLVRSGSAWHEHSALGFRVAMRSGPGGLRFLHLHGDVPRVLADIGASVTRYLWDDDGVLGQIDGDGDALYFFEDHLGSIRAVMDARGRVVAEGDYTPYGTPIRRIQGVRFGFAGEEQDEDGLVHLRARTYEPRIGRFLSKDPLPPRLLDIGKQNRYAYAANAPTNFVDRKGQHPARPADGKISPSFDDVQRYLILLMQDEGLDHVQLSQVVGVEDLIWPLNWDIQRVQVAGIGDVDMNHMVSQMFHPNDFMGSVMRDFRNGTLPVYFLFKDVVDVWIDRGQTIPNDLADIRGNIVGTLLNLGAVDLLPRTSAFRPDFIQAINNWITSDRSAHSISLGQLLGRNLQQLMARPIVDHQIRLQYQPIRDRFLHESGQPSTRGGSPQSMPATPARSDERASQNSQGNEARLLADFMMSAIRDAEQAISQHPVTGGPGQVAGPGGYARAEAYEAVAAFKAMRAQQVPAVGGVWLAKAAEAIGSLGCLEGAVFDTASERLVLVGSDARSAVLPPVKPEHLAVALASVFGSDTEEPGVTIDPAPEDPHGPRMAVRFFGGVANTAFGLTLFEADRVMKCLSLGEDNATHQAASVDVPGYGNLLALGLANAGFSDAGHDLWSRFWLVPDQVLVQAAPDRRSISFPDTRIAVRTETMRWKNGKLVPAGREKDAKAEQFAAHFTEHYDAYAAQHPVFRELKGLANLVGLAKWLQESAVPVDLDWITRYRRPVPTPESTPSHRVTREQAGQNGVTRCMSVFGGVDLSVRNLYVADDDAATQSMAHDALRAVAQQHGVAIVQGDGDGPGRRRILALPTSRARAPETALLAEGELLLVPRIYCSAHDDPSPFGHAWVLDLPSLHISVPDKTKSSWVTVGSRKVTLREFRLVRPFGLTDVRFKRHVFDAQREQLAFVPERGGEGIRALYPDADDAGCRVEFGNGLAQHFDAQGALVGTACGGVTISYRRDGAGRLEAIDLSRAGVLRYRITLTHDAQGRISRADTPGGPIDYHYDSASDLVFVARPDGGTAYRYDDRHRLTGVTVDGRETLNIDLDRYGAVTACEDSGSGSLSAAIEPMNGGVTVTRRAGGVEMLRRYDRAGRLVESRLPTGRVLRAEYDALGRTVSISSIDRSGESSRLEFAGDGRRMILRTATNDEVEVRLDDFDRLTQVLARGRPRITLDYLRTTTGWMETAETASRRVSRRFDTEGRVVECFLSSTDAAGGQLRLRMQHGTELAGAAVRIDADGLVSAQWQLVDGRVRSHRLGADVVDCAYDPQGRVVRITSPDTTFVVTRATDGSVGRTDTARGGTRLVVEYRAGLPVQRTIGEDRTDRFGFDARGRLISVDHSDGDQWSLQRTEREIQVRRGGALQCRLTFDDAGRVIEFAD